MKLVRAESTKTIANFPKPPYDFPLLLTADECIQKFDEKTPVIKSKYSSVFSNKLRCFLHPSLLDIGLNENYFLMPQSENKSLIFEMLNQTLPNSLTGIHVVSNASSLIQVDKVLKPLWQCLHLDSVFSQHVNEIVQNWALILSKDDNLYVYNPSHEYLMPVVHPKPLPTSESTAPYEERLELEKQHKVFNLLCKCGMPRTHDIILKAWYYCPTLNKPSSILKNLYYLHRKQKLILSDTNIELIFSYFKSIHFQNDETSLNLIKSLSLFKSIDGRYCSLSSDAYLWPENVCMSGIDKLLPQSTSVFLNSNGAWTKLATGDTLNVKHMESLYFYTDCVFPYFHTLN